MVFRLGSQAELDAIMEENSAVYGEKTLRMMYNLATAAPYGFFYVKMTATKPVDMFWKGFGSRLVVKDV